jgi:nitroreductase
MTITPEKLMTLMKTRRSVRKYAPGPVPEKDVDAMLEAASWAPSGTNTQNWHFIVVRSPDLRRRMHDAVARRIEELKGKIASPRGQKEFVAYSGYYGFFKDAPVAIAAVKKPYESLAKRILKRYDLAQDLFSSADVQGPAAAVENLLLMAHALGYGACWMTGPLIAREELEKVLGIAAPDELFALIPLGKATGAVTPPKRKDLNEIREFV